TERSSAQLTLRPCAQQWSRDAARDGATGVDDVELVHAREIQRPPFRPGLPGVPPVSSFDGRRLLELPGSQPSAPFPTPWLQRSRSFPPGPLPPDDVAQPFTAVPVIVTSAIDQALPLKLPPVSVIAAPARMLPWKF